MVTTCGRQNEEEEKLIQDQDLFLWELEDFIFNTLVVRGCYIENINTINIVYYY